MTQISVESKDLARAIGVVSRVINKRNTFPILDNVLLSQRDSAFYVTGSNNEAWGTMKMAEESMTVINGSAASFNKICLPAETMKQMLASCAGQRLVCEIDEEKLMMTVTYNTGNFNVPVVSAEEYPEPKNTGNPVCAFHLQGGWLASRVKAAKVCVAENNLRPVMSNIALDVDYEGVNIAGTDGHTLYKDRLQVGVGAGFLEGEPNIVLMHQSVFDIIQTAFAAAEDIHVASNGQMVTMRSDDFTLIYRSTEGRYPNYNTVIPKAQPCHVTVSVAALTSAMRRVAIFASESSNMIVLGWDNGKLVLSADDKDYGRAAKEDVAPSCEDANLPDGFCIGMKAASLLALLGCVSTDTAILEFSDNMRAMTIREEDANSNVVLLQMPMRMDEPPMPQV